MSRSVAQTCQPARLRTAWYPSRKPSPSSRTDDERDHGQHDDHRRRRRAARPAGRREPPRTTSSRPAARPRPRAARTRRPPPAAPRAPRPSRRTRPPSGRRGAPCRAGQCRRAGPVEHRGRPDPQLARRHGVEHRGPGRDLGPRPDAGAGRERAARPDGRALVDPHATHPQHVPVQPVPAQVDLRLDGAPVAEREQAGDRRQRVQVDVAADRRAERPRVLRRSTARRTGSRHPPPRPTTR